METTITSRIYLGDGQEAVHYSDGTEKLITNFNVELWLQKNNRKSYCDTNRVPHLNLNYDHEETY